MSSLEFNKIAAGVLIAGLVAMASGIVAEALYHEEAPEKRGFSVEVADGGNGGSEAPAANEPEKIDLHALMAAADPKAGAEIFKKCGTCHTSGKGEPNKVGPNLWGVLGGPMAHSKDFGYSKGMTEKAAAGGKWDYNSIFTFLKKPGAFVSGTKMSFAGLAKPEDRANVIAYLRSQSDSQQPLP